MLFVQALVLYGLSGIPGYCQKSHIELSGSPKPPVHRVYYVKSPYRRANSSLPSLLNWKNPGEEATTIFLLLFPHFQAACYINLYMNVITYTLDSKFTTFPLLPFPYPEKDTVTLHASYRSSPFRQTSCKFLGFTHL